MITIATLAFVASIFCILGGLASLTNATLGVGSICGACWLAIVARLAQASAHHRDLLRRMPTPLPELAPIAQTAAENIMTCPHCAASFTRGPSACPSCGQALK